MIFSHCLRGRLSPSIIIHIIIQITVDFLTFSHPLTLFLFPLVFSGICLPETECIIKLTISSLSKAVFAEALKFCFSSFGVCAHACMDSVDSIFFPAINNTPVGFCTVYHGSLGVALVVLCHFQLIL